MKEQNITGSKKLNLESEQLAIRGSKNNYNSPQISWQKFMLCDDAELPGCNPNKDQKWTLMTSL